MSQQYNNTLRGALFVNERKQQPNHPDYKGSLTDGDGREYWVSAWIKAPRSGGDDYISLALTPKEGAPQGNKPAGNSDAKAFLNRNKDKIDGHRPAQPPAQDYDSFDDGIPF